MSAEEPPKTPACKMEDVARRTGLTPRAIRYYEEMGLLHPHGRTAGGFRLFTEAQIAQLMRIKELQALLGFSLAEIKETLHIDAARAELRKAYHRTTDPAARRRILDKGIILVQSQLRVIDERTARLTRLREEYQELLGRLRRIRRELNEALATPAGHRAETRNAR